MTINTPLLRKAIEFAEASAARQAAHDPGDPNSSLDFRTDPNPLTWNQGSWSTLKTHYVTSPEKATLEHCGTAFCIAGFVATQLDGYDAKLVTTKVGPNHYGVDLEETIDGNEFVHMTVAADALGLSAVQAERLFEAYNTIEDVRAIAETIAGERL